MYSEHHDTKVEMSSAEPKRRMTLPSRSQSNYRRIHVSPTLLEMDEGFHERQFAARTSDNFVSPRLFMDVTAHAPLSYSSPEIHKVSDLVEANINGDLWKKPPIKQDFRAMKMPAASGGASSEDSFFCSIRPLLYVFQVFGLLPVVGIGAADPSQLKFVWKHWKTAITFVNLAGVGFVCTCSALRCLLHGFSYDRSVNLVFYAYGTVGIVLFLNLARHWKQLNMYYSKTDHILVDYGYPKGQRRKFLICTIVIGILSLAEHLLSKVDNLFNALSCLDFVDDTLYAFLVHQYPQIFKLMEYNVVIAIIAFLSNFTATVCWNLTDLFLGLIAMSLSARLVQINRRLFSIQGQDKPSSFWRKIREEYNAVSVLTKQVDIYIQYIMLFSLGNNLFFICLQLLKSMKPRTNVYEVVYFFGSFALLILRTGFVTLCAASVHDNSCEGKTVLYSVPHESYTREVKRFLTQLTTDELVLTGCRFFSVTRGLILTIAGTVVTYEIVLVQFKTDVDTEDIQNVTACSPFTQHQN